MCPAGFSKYPTVELIWPTVKWIYPMVPLRTLLGEGNEEFISLLFSRIKPEQICYVGLRDLDQAESEYIIQHNISTITDCQFEKVQNIIKNFKNVYIHLDLDVLDKSEYEFSMFTTNIGSSISEVAEPLT